MYSYRKRIAALLLTMTLALSLTACGDGDTKKKDPGKNDSKGEDLSSTVYTTEVKELTIGDKQIYAISSQDVAAVGKDIYFFAYTYSSGEEDEGMYPEIFHVDAETGEIRELEGFSMPAAEDADTDLRLDGVAAGADGTIWIGVTVNKAIFELPTDFDEEKDDRWKYYKGSERKTTWHRVDASGNEISSVEIKEDKDGDQGSEQSGQIHRRYATLFDDDGCCYYRDERNIYVKDPAKDSTIQIDAKGIEGDMVRLGDGTIGVFDRVYKKDRPRCVTLVDKAEKKLGVSYPIDGNIDGDIFPGSGRYLFLYTSGDTLYGYTDENTPAERIFSWASVNMTYRSARAISLLEDGRIAVLTSEDGRSAEEKTAIRLVMLKPGDASALPEKEHLTLACLFMQDDLRRAVISFNSENTEVHIDIKDYSEFNTKDDHRLGATKLMTEIAAGNVPDMLVTNNLPISQYMARGLFEDLWPYIDNDPELSRDQLMIRPLEAAQVDGKLPQIFSGFSIRANAGLTENVGDRIGWTVDEMKAAMEKLPEGARAYSESTTKERLLNQFLPQVYDDFINWSTGECYYDSQEFIDILKFCDQYGTNKEDVNWNALEDEASVIGRGMQLLMLCELNDLQSMQVEQAIFKGDITYVGSPTPDGSSSSTFVSSDGIAMSATCKNKEAAWQFMRSQLMYGSVMPDRMWFFPVNKGSFDAFVKEQMKKTYRLDVNGKEMLDKNGEPIEESKCTWYAGDLAMDLYAATQEDLDDFMQVYDATETMFSVDWNIQDIIETEAVPFFKGDKTAEEAAKQIQSRMMLYVNEQM